MKGSNSMSKLRDLRTAQGLSQSELAALSEVNVHMIQKYEQGVKDINKAEAMRLYQLSQALHCKIEDLLEI